jgi:geranylgeranyl diphosphate synthase type 3
MILPRRPEEAGLDPEILAPFHYTLQGKGKKVREVLVDCFQVWMDVPLEVVLAVKYVAEVLHTASLIVDDIEDNTEIRRGDPAAHVVFGTPLAMNAANCAYFLAVDKIASLGKLEAVQSFIHECKLLHLGQGLDIYWREKNMCPSMEEYRRMVSHSMVSLVAQSLLCY